MAKGSMGSKQKPKPRLPQITSAYRFQGETIALGSGWVSDPSHIKLVMKLLRLTGSRKNHFPRGIPTRAVVQQWGEYSHRNPGSQGV